MAPGSEPRERLIKRYENRKLYDTAARRYVTLEDLAAIVAGGGELKVVDQASGEDLTSLILAQVVFEGVKQRTADVPRQVLARLIRLGAHGSAPATQGDGIAERASREAERIVSDLIARGRLSLEEAIALRGEIAGTLQRLVLETQRGIERSLKGLLARAEQDEGVSPALSTLKERLYTLENWLGARPAPRRTAPARDAGRRRRP